jgi:PKD repeat protein
MRTLRTSSVLALAVLAACAQTVQRPVANAGADQAVHVGQSVQLDGSNSKDPQGRTLAFQWSFADRPAGSTATIADPTSAKTSFVADKTGTYKVQLIVTNSLLASDPSIETVTVDLCGQNKPTINTLASTPSPVPFVGATFVLSAVVSDADNTAACGSLGQTFTYKWSIIQEPAGSTAALNNANLQSPSVKSDVAGDYTVRLVVTDSTGLSSDPKDVTVTVNPCGNNRPQITDSKATPGAPIPNQVVSLTVTAQDADTACNL